MRRFLIVLGILLMSAAAIYGGLALVSHSFARWLSSADPIPGFMADYETKSTGSDERAIRTFPEFLAQAFPTGTDAKDAIAQITRGGFAVTTSSSDSVELLWRRHAGPCSEVYSITIGQSADGRIAKITGRLHPVCL